MEAKQIEKTRVDINAPYIEVLNAKKRYNLICGGRAGGRSYFASQVAVLKLFSQNYFRCGIMRYVAGDIRNSIYQEIIDRLSDYDLADEKELEIKEHLLTINFKQNTINGIGFRKSSGDQKAKLKSLAGYTDIIIEEAEEVAEEDFMQLDDSLRTIKADVNIYLLFNLPPKNHWMVKRWFNLIPSGVDGFYKIELKESEKHNTLLIHTTYKDNEIHLNQTTIDNFERYRETRPDHYWNMIQGLVSDGARGRIYKNWQPISDKEYEALDYSVFYGLDFGFTNDPTAIVEVKVHNDNVYVKELLYQTGLINVRISDKLKDMGINGSKEIYCDSAEPKSVAELRTYNWNAISADKGAGSRKAGVDLLLGKNIYYTESSTNLISEMQTYCWALNKEKEPTNEPSDGNDHLLDAFRYAVYTKSKQPYIGF
jgi:phage terminase large subunit